MILRIEDIKGLCSKISAALDISENDQITSVLQLKADGQYLSLIVSNREYYVEAKLNLYENNNFNATVNASLLLNLIANTTSDTIRFECHDSFLCIEGNGTYKIPLICDDTGMLSVPKIAINNVTSEFDIDKDILMSIYNYNSKEMLKPKEIFQRPVQKLYYIDNEGCITFTNGACVNKFTLEKPIKLLLTQKVVKLFKLFNSTPVHFRYGHDALTDGTLQAKCSFADDTITITTILPSDDQLIQQVPVSAIRARAFDDYTTSVNLNKVAFLDALKRLMLFIPKNTLPTAKLVFKEDAVAISDQYGNNNEVLYYGGTEKLTEEYEMYVDLLDLKLTLEGCTEQYVSVNFGNHLAVVVARGNIYNVIPEKSL